jgi:hypothetical protein
MGRTRKWVFVAQEAGRLADIGMSPGQIAAALKVAPSTVTRWMQKGRIRRTKGVTGRPRRSVMAPVRQRQTPVEWAAAVREEYSFSPTDDMLVTLGQMALEIALDPRSDTRTQNAATARFRAIARDLDLGLSRQPEVVPQEPVPPVKEPRTPLRLVAERKGDPRALLCENGNRPANDGGSQAQ